MRFQQKRLRFMAHCHRVWSKNFILLLLIIIMQWSIVLWGNYHRYLLTHIGVMILDSFLVISGSCYFVAMLGVVHHKKLRRIIWTFILAILAILFAVEVFVIIEYGMLFGEGLIIVILETNFTEATEYIGLVWQQCLLVISFTSAMMIVGYSFHKKWQQRPKNISRKFLVIVQPEIIGAFIAAIYIRPIGGEAPFDLPLTQIVSATYQALEDMAHYEDMAKNLSSEVHLIGNDSKIPYVVFVLGESTQRNFMHLYGYPLPNTPHLDALANNGELAVFQDVISAKHGTVLSLREIFTFHDWESEKEWYQCGNLFDILRQAGYISWWLSNQDSFGIWGNTGTLFANRADYAVFTKRRASQDDFGSLDEELLTLLDDALTESKEKNFYVLHLMGCHVLYNLRYPANFNKFAAKDIEDNLSTDWKQDIAAYNNAVLYNDFILANIIERFRDKDAVVIYLSDHGENVHDEGTALLGHAYGKPNRYLYEIPMLIWVSDYFRQNHSDKWTAIQNSVSRPFMTDDLIHTLLGLMDIKTVEYDEKKNLFSSRFNVNRKRMVQDLDYDKSLRNENIEE